MQKKRLNRIYTIGGAIGLLCSSLMAETVGLFLDTTVAQIKFAGGDVKTALEAKGHTVQMFGLNSLSSPYANKKVVISVAGNSTVTSALTSQGGSAPGSLTEQAYALRTTSQGQTSFWAIGGDVNGAMYGGLQIAENITLNNLTGNYNSEEKPFMEYRGMKLNMPLDRRIPTYVGSFKSRSTKFAIPHVYDSTFWKGLIDEQARNRYNLISVWVHNPFPALVKTPSFERATLPNIEGFNGFVLNWDHDQRVAYWRSIMRYAHSRGMKFYFFNWNIIVDYAKDQGYGIDNSGTNATTKTYLGNSLKALIETYPELDGFGVSIGDGMPSGWGESQKQAWSWDVYGKAMKEYLDANPGRKFHLIHRSLGIGPDTFYGTGTGNYNPLISTKNAQVDFSVKYAMAHMYSTPTPDWTSDIKTIASKYSSNKTFITTRNDDFVYLNWGDPKFVRDFLAGVPEKQIVKGMYIGADGWSPARNYHYLGDYKSLNGQLEVTRRWYMEMLWGRLGYNPATSDDVLKNLLSVRYPSLPSNTLFEAWALASRPLPKMTELIMGEWTLDHDWWPEACWSDPGRHEGFRSIQGMAGEPTKSGNGTEPGTTVAKGSQLCDIKNSAANTCGGKKNSYTVANEMQADAEQAMKLVNTLSTGGKLENRIAINNIKQMSSLSNYYAHKVRGATQRKAGKTDSARTTMGIAYCHWINYTRAMEEMYVPDTVREVTLPDWKFGDAAVAKEFTDLGGNMANLKCSELVANQPILTTGKLEGIFIKKFQTSGIQFTLPEAGVSNVTIFDVSGRNILQEKKINGKAGLNDVKFSKPLKNGLHFIRIKTEKQTKMELLQALK